MSKKSTAVKGAALTAGTSMVVFGMQQALAGEVITGGIGMLIALLLFAGYSYADEIGQQKKVNDLIDEIGEETFQELAEVSAEQLKQALEDFNSSGGGNQSQK